jgi:hypothetical protein
MLLAGIWIDGQDVLALPTSGPAWDAVWSAAQKDTSSPNLSDQDDNTDVYTLAKALVGVRLADERLLSQARASIMAAIGTEDGGRSLALARNLASYVIAADLVGLDAKQDLAFRSWLRETLTEVQADGRSLQSTHEDRPNNWGTMAGGSRAAVAAYLGDAAELARTAQVFEGWLGNRSAYAGFNYDSDLSWQADPSRPVGINPLGATKEGHSIDGALPEEMRRGGSFQWPPIETGYPWGALQGAVVQAEILYRAGYDTWQWQDRALLRAVEFLYGLGWSPEGDDEWTPWLVDARYGTSFAANASAKHGKIMGWTSWTHQAAETSPSILISISDATVTEGNSGTVGAVFTVWLSRASEETVTVAFATQDGSAVSPADYTATQGVLTFAPGVTQQVVLVTVHGDTLSEPSEEFAVLLSSATGAALADAQGIGRIVNDDLPALSITSVAAAEGKSGRRDFVFTVSLSSASDQPITVAYSTADGSANSTDYRATSGVLSFAPGETIKRITVKVYGDTLAEPDETFFVHLHSASGAKISSNVAVGTILNDDSQKSGKFEFKKF